MPTPAAYGLTSRISPVHSRIISQISQGRRKYLLSATADSKMTSKDGGIGTYVCRLPKEVADKAEKELNEIPEKRKQDIEDFRNMLIAHPGLKCRRDDVFLLRFLRARKFQHDRAYALLLTYYRLRAHNPRYLGNLKPSTVKHVLEAGVTGVLPQRNKDGCMVMVFSIGKWDPTAYPIFDNLRINLLTMEKIIQDEESQVHGIRLLVNLTEMSMTHVKNFDRQYAKLTSKVIQDAFPMRLKGVHFWNNPSIFDIVFQIAKPFMKHKLASRLHFHGTSEESLHAHISPQILPEDFGGTQPAWTNKAWMDTMLAAESEFEEELKYRIEELPDPELVFGTSLNDDNLQGVAGSFRKLNVD